MKAIRIFFTSLFIFLLAIAGTQTAFAQEILTIDDVVRLALDNNLSLQRLALNTNSLKRAADRSWNSLLPTLNASALISHPTSITGEIQPRQTMSLDGRVQDRDVWTPGFSLSAGFTLSASIFENIKKARADYEAGLLGYDAARQDLELLARNLFYQILLLDANRELSIQNFQSAEARYEQTLAMTRVGQAPRLDELSARVDMENMRPLMRNAEMLYENALVSLKTVMGIPTETEIKLDGDLTVRITSEPVENVLLRRTDSLEITRMLASIRSMEAQRNAVRNNAYFPSLRLSWTSTPLYNLQNSYWNDSGSFSISLGINIDNFLPWSAARTQIDAFNDNISAMHIQLSESIRNQDDRLQHSRRNILRIAESIETMELNVELAESTYTQFEDAYRAGAADYQRLRGARDSLEQARNRLLTEQYNLLISLLELEKEWNIPFGTIIRGE